MNYIENLKAHCDEIKGHLEIKELQEQAIQFFTSEIAYLEQASLRN